MSFPNCFSYQVETSSIPAQFAVTDSTRDNSRRNIDIPSQFSNSKVDRIRFC